MRHELTGRRDLAYSLFHRSLDDELNAIDLDGVVFTSGGNTGLCDGAATKFALFRKPSCKVVALIEAAQTGSKSVRVLVQLARQAGCYAIKVLHSGAGDQFELRNVSVWSPSGEYSDFGGMSKEEYEALLLALVRE